MLPFLGLMFMDAGASATWGAAGSRLVLRRCVRLAGNSSPFPSLLVLGQLLCCSGQQGL